MTDAHERSLACPSCQNEFTKVVKFIPDCGKLICAKCYDHMIESLDSSHKYKCQVCHKIIFFPTWAFPIATSLSIVPWQRLKPRSSKRLARGVEKQQKKLESFDATQCIDEHCDRLEREVSQAAAQAVEHIGKIEASLHHKIKEYRQRCINAQSEEPKQRSKRKRTNSELEALSRQVKQLSSKWNSFFGRPDSFASESEIHDALYPNRDLERSDDSSR